jgi:ribosomal protein S18 acetylase RimI-like enzyme
MNLRLRNAGPHDSHQIAAVFDAAVREAWPWLGLTAQRALFTDDEWSQLVADHAPPNILLVAESDEHDSVLGFVAAHPLDGELFMLFVDPRQAGRGIGRRLLDAAHDGMRSAGRRQAFLFTHERNMRAIDVYRRAGYVHDGTYRESAFHGIALREMRLVKNLYDAGTTHRPPSTGVGGDERPEPERPERPAVVAPGRIRNGEPAEAPVSDHA